MKELQFRQIFHTVSEGENYRSEHLFGIDNNGNLYRFNFFNKLWERFPCQGR